MILASDIVADLAIHLLIETGVALIRRIRRGGGAMPSEPLALPPPRVASPPPVRTPAPAVPVRWLPATWDVRSQLPGRVRLAVPGLQDNPAGAEALTTALRGVDGIQRVTANPITGTVLIHYDAAQTSLLPFQAAVFQTMRQSTGAPAVTAMAAA